jgi:hypothetical protein
MAYIGANVTLITEGIAATSPQVFTYNTTDSLATVEGAGYFSDGNARGLRVNDIVLVVNTTTNVCDTVVVTAAGATTSTVAAGPSDVADVQYTTSSVTTGSIAAGIITGANDCVWNQTGATPGAQLVRTAAQLLGDTPNGRVGQSTTFRIIETGAGTLTLTTDAGATVTMTGTMTVPTNTFRDFMLTFNTATTATVQSLGAGDI